MSTTDASCRPTGYRRGADGFELFGMGFLGDGHDEKLFIVGGRYHGAGDLGRLGVIDALRHAGVKPGHDVAIGDERFEFSIPPEEAVVYGDAGDEADDIEW